MQHFFSAHKVEYNYFYKIKKNWKYNQANGLKCLKSVHLKQIVQKKISLILDSWFLIEKNLD
jgi:hypothetical protein